MRRKLFILVLLVTVCSGAVLILWEPAREKVVRLFQGKPETLFDKATQQKPVLTDAGIDSVLGHYPVLKYEELPEWWISFTESDKMKGELTGKKYLVIRGPERYRFVVANHRIRDFLPKDSIWVRCERQPDSSCVQYWLLQPKVLHKFRTLLDSLQHRDYDVTAIRVRNGFRHHKLNYDGGGAAKSRHRLGEAIDLYVGDIDRNGKEEKKDKDIVLDLLDKYIIKSGGGVGRYPGTQAVHMDVRGHRARWDSYTPGNQKQ